MLAAFAPQIELASETLLDFKSALQEQLARQGRRVSYEVTAESGPPHGRPSRSGRGSTTSWSGRGRAEQEGGRAGRGGGGAGELTA